MPRARLIHQTPIFSPDEILGLVPLSPCALIMYLWIQTIAIEDGVREVDLQEFIDYSCTDRRKGYEMKWVKKSFHEIEQMELITITKKYNSTVFKVKVWRPRLKLNDPASPEKIEA